MKDRFTLAVVVALALTCGVLGTMLFSSTQAQAQRRWSFCFAADFDHLADGDNPEHMRNAHGGMAVPSGWTPVGGTGGISVILCR